MNDDDHQRNYELMNNSTSAVLHRSNNDKEEKRAKFNSTLLGFEPNDIIEQEVCSESSKIADLYSSYGKYKNPIFLNTPAKMENSSLSSTYTGATFVKQLKHGSTFNRNSMPHYYYGASENNLK